MKQHRPYILFTSLSILTVYAVVIPIFLLFIHWEHFRNVCSAFILSAKMYLSIPSHAALTLITGLLTTGFLYAALWTLKNLRQEKLRTHSSDSKHEQLCAMTIGFLQPKVIISNVVKQTLSAEAYAAIAAHEEYHRAHYHPLIIFITGFISRWFFFVPFAKCFFERLVLHLELKADAYAIAQTSRKALASALHEFFSYRQTSPVPFGAHFSFFTERVEAVIGTRKKPSYNAVFFWPAAVMTFLGMLFPLYIVNTADLQQEPYEREVNFFCIGGNLPAHSPMTPVQSKLTK